MATKNQLKTSYLILYYPEQDHIDYIPTHLGLFGANDQVEERNKAPTMVFVDNCLTLLYHNLNQN